MKDKGITKTEMVAKVKARQKAMMAQALKELQAANEAERKPGKEN